MAETKPAFQQNQTADFSSNRTKNPKDVYNYHFSNFTAKMTTRVILHLPSSALSSSLGSSSSLCSLCEDAGYLCELSNGNEQTLALLQDITFQNILVVPVQNTMDQDTHYLLSFIQSQDLGFTLSIVALLSSTSSSSSLSSSTSVLSSVKASLLETLLQYGVSRIVNQEEIPYRLVTELKLAEKTELQTRETVQFSRALLEAIENSHDAVQITGKDSCILYVNKAFTDLNGFSQEECIGKPALSVLQLENWGSTWLQDNGTTSLLDRKERWEGACVARRRSGSAMKHYFKLLPVTTTSGHLLHHVMIQRLLSPHEHLISPIQRHSSSLDGFNMFKKSSTGNLPRLSSLSEAPLVKAVAMIAAAREDPTCSAEMRESLDKCMEYLRFEELYTPFTHLPSGRTGTGIVDGLLYPNRRFSLAGEHQRVMAHPHSHHGIRLQICDTPPKIKECMGNLATWDFNILALEAISNHEPLYYVGMEIFSEFRVAETLDIDHSVVAAWLKMMERNYHRNNAYHNSTHAADVLQATAYLVRVFQQAFQPDHPDHMEPLEIAALLITAVIHDLDHPGRTNPFLNNTSSEKAILYNDRAVLENHHVAFSFKLTLQNRQVNLYQSLSRATYQSIRASIIDLVLATDMSKHFEHVNKFSTTFLQLQVESIDETGSTTNILPPPVAPENREGRNLAKRILVKCADIANACRPIDLCKAWASRIAEEYFAQTDEEKKLNLPVVFPDFDRETCNLPATQVKFVDVFVSGLFQAWHSYCEIPDMIGNLESNYEYWKEQNESDSSQEPKAEDNIQEKLKAEGAETTESSTQS